MSWTYGVTYFSIIGMFVGTMVTLFGVNIPTASSTDQNLPPPRPLVQLFKIPRFLLALVSATIGYRLKPRNISTNQLKTYSMMVFVMVLVPLEMDKSGFPFEDIGHVLQVHSVGMFGPGPFIGHFIEKYGPVLIISIGFIATIASNVIMAVGTAYWNFMVGMTLLGIGWNFVFVSATTLLTQTYTVSIFY